MKSASLPPASRAVWDLTTRSWWQELYVGLLMAAALTVVQMRELMQLNGFFITTAAGVWLLGGNWAARWQRIRGSVLMRLIASYLFFCLLYTLLHIPIGQAVKELERQLALLVFPLLLCSQPLTRRQGEDVALALLAGTAILLVILWPGAVLVNIDEWPWNYEVVGNSLVFHLHLHRVYVALHLAGGMALAWQLRNRLGLVLVWIYTIAAFGVIVILGARMVLLSGIVTTVALVFLVALRDRQRRLWALGGLGVLAVLLALAGLWARHNPHLGRFYKGLSWAPLPPAQTVSPNESITMRRYIWHEALQVRQQMGPAEGLGLGGAMRALHPRYLAIGLRGDNGEQPSYNAHNQWLQTSIELGWGGMVALLAVLLWPLYHSVRQKRYFYAAILLLVFLCCQTECLFDANKGIVWIALVLALFAFSLKPNAALPSYED